MTNAGCGHYLPCGMKDLTNDNSAKSILASFKKMTENEIANSKGLKIPLSIGTIGGITDIHPMVKLSLKLLENPTSDKLMNIICSVGLAQNFAAVKSLVTSGIQKGHMKMHLINLLIKQNATKDQINKAEAYFKDRDINSQSVKDFLDLN